MPDILFDGATDQDPSRPLNRRERAVVLARIEALMEFWNISVEELQGESPAEPWPPVPRVVKYRHPVTAETWDGLGDHPEWLRHALLKEGYRVEELKPDNQALALPSDESTPTTPSDSLPN